ncbi:MAG: TRZ/ATZ family protein [Candidatus Omnitrophota bacterium]|nr:MAG: TRZ/ATZ family protein [Candidatus Omnitrophota bacterium]
MKKLTLPLTEKDIISLRAGDEVFLTGTLYTARDQAHRMIAEAIARRKRIPFTLKNAMIYYCGPTQAQKGKAIGACGPTTSSRMDIFTPALLNAGVKGMIGKGQRSLQVRQAIREHKAVYFLTYAGCAALLHRYVKKAKVVAFRELGPEAVHQLYVELFPVIVGIDAQGTDVYKKRGI